MTRKKAKGKPIICHKCKTDNSETWKRFTRTADDDWCQYIMDFALCVDCNLTLREILKQAYLKEVEAFFMIKEHDEPST